MKYIKKSAVISKLVTAARARVSPENPEFQRFFNFCVCNIAQNLIADIHLGTASLIQSLVSVDIESVVNVIELLF